MKKLISLISTEGKSVEQIRNEAWEAFLKYQKTGQPTIIMKKEKGQAPDEPSVSV